MMGNTNNEYFDAQELTFEQIKNHNPPPNPRYNGNKSKSCSGGGVVHTRGILRSSKKVSPLFHPSSAPSGFYDVDELMTR